MIFLYKNVFKIQMKAYYKKIMDNNNFEGI